MDSPWGRKESDTTEQLHFHFSLSCIGEGNGLEGNESEKVKVTQLCLTLCDPMDCPWNSPGQKTGVGSLSLLQGIFPTQGSNPGLLHCRRAEVEGKCRFEVDTFSGVFFPLLRPACWEESNWHEPRAKSP